jgi:hypothetical protein
MSRRLRPDREALLDRLPRIEPPPRRTSDEDMLEQMSLASGLLALAGIDHEREYAACRSAAEHLLGDLPEPADGLPASS